MKKKKLSLQERMLEANIDELDWNCNVGKSKSNAIKEYQAQENKKNKLPLMVSWLVM